MINLLMRYPVLKFVLSLYAIITFIEGYSRGHFYQRFAYYGLHLTPLLGSVIKMLLLIGAAYLFRNFAIKQVQTLTEFETDTLRLSTIDRLKVFGLRAVTYLFILSALASTGYTLGRLTGLVSLF